MRILRFFSSIIISFCLLMASASSAQNIEEAASIQKLSAEVVAIELTKFVQKEYQLILERLQVLDKLARSLEESVLKSVLERQYQVQIKSGKSRKKRKKKQSLNQELIKEIKKEQELLKESSIAIQKTIKVATNLPEIIIESEDTNDISKRAYLSQILALISAYRGIANAKKYLISQRAYLPSDFRATKLMDGVLKKLSQFLSPKQISFLQKLTMLKVEAQKTFVENEYSGLAKKRRELSQDENEFDFSIPKRLNAIAHEDATSEEVDLIDEISLSIRKASAARLECICTLIILGPAVKTCADLGKSFKHEKEFEKAQMFDNFYPNILALAVMEMSQSYEDAFSEFIKVQRLVSKIEDMSSTDDLSQDSVSDESLEEYDSEFSDEELSELDQDLAQAEKVGRNNNNNEDEELSSPKNANNNNLEENDDEIKVEPLQNQARELLSAQELSVVQLVSKMKNKKQSLFFNLLDKKQRSAMKQADLKAIVKGLGGKQTHRSSAHITYEIEGFEPFTLSAKHGGKSKKGNNKATKENQDNLVRDFKRIGLLTDNLVEYFSQF